MTPSICGADQKMRKKQSEMLQYIKKEIGWCSCNTVLPNDYGILHLKTKKLLKLTEIVDKFEGANEKFWE